MTDTLENKEALEEAGFTPKQSTALARILEKVAQRISKSVTQTILPNIDAKFEQVNSKFELIAAEFERVDEKFERVDEKFEENERLAQVRHENLKSSISMLTWVLGLFAAVMAIFMAVISYMLLG